MSFHIPPIVVSIHLFPLNIFRISLRRWPRGIQYFRHSLQAFGKFVPKNIVKRLTQKNLDVRIGGKSKQLTIYFSDIENFTGVSEAYPPEKLMPHLSEYFEVLTNIVQEYHGTVEECFGGAV